ncbi:MAG: tripartite tricarboxylate transporter substrate binding protein [Streptosporangiales bacterium]|nr:tripartite tricarboxylate transporter substrate binding protein [Streptosporangiales bacterium]
MTSRLRVLAGVVALAAAVAACGSGGGATSGNYPSETLHWTIAFGPGGGNDIMSRTIVDILKKENLYPNEIEVTNREGGSGARGWGYVYAHRGDPYQISTTSGSFLTTPLQAGTGWAPNDFTPVGLFAQDDLLFLVSPKSGIESWEQWVERAKGNAKGVPVGGIGTVNVDFIDHQMLADQAGYKISYVPFDDEGQLINALLSGSVEAIVSNPAEVLGQVESGDMVPLLFTGKESPAAVSDVPTAEELGFEGLLAMPRGVILAPDAGEEAQRWWIETMRKVVKTPAWRQYLKENQLIADVRWGEDFATYIDSTNAEFTEVLRDQGVLDR